MFNSNLPLTLGRKNDTVVTPTVVATCMIALNRKALHVCKQKENVFHNGSGLYDVL